MKPYEKARNTNGNVHSGKLKLSSVFELQFLHQLTLSPTLVLYSCVFFIKGKHEKVNIEFHQCDPFGKFDKEKSMQLINQN